jgi:signal transduction histidine kinase
MNFRIIVLLIMSVLFAILGILIYTKGWKNISNRIYGLFVVNMVLWSFCLAMLYVSSDVSKALFWSRLIYLAGGLIPAFFLYFSFVFPESKISISPIKQCLIFVPNIILFVIYFFSDFFLAGVVVQENMRGFIYGHGHFLFDLHFAIFFLWAFLRFIKKYKNSTGIIREQLKYIIGGTIIGVILASITNVILPWFGYFNLLWLGPLLTATWLISIAYAIIRYRLMDIRIGVRKSFIYLSLSLFAYTVFYTTANLYKTIWGDVFAIQGYVVGIFIAIAFTALFFLVQKNIQKFVNKYLYASVYNTQKTLKELADGLTTLLKLDEVINSIVETIMSTLGLDSAGVLLRDFSSKKYKIAKIIGFNRKNGISLVQDNFLTKRLKETGRPLVFEELELIMRDVDSKTKKDIERVRDNMQHIEANFCLPLLARDELIGMIVLGSKLNGEAYSGQDIDLLKSVAAQASIAISNAQLYNEMEKIVSSQTKELRIKNRDLKKLNKDLKETLEAKSNFLTVASHQLRTPTSVIKGMLDMLMDETVPNNKKDNFVQRCSAQALRLSNTIHDLLSSTAIEGRGFELNKSLTNIDELIAKMVKERLMKLEQNNKKTRRNVELIYQQPKTKTLSIKIDPNKIEEVVANLIDNAIQYTLKGKIEIITKIDGKNFIFTIRDTGIGIGRQDLPKLFKKIARLPNAIQVCPDGTGLGLFIIKGMVEKHGGGVEVKSGGANKGSEFTFWLPVG